MSQKAAVTVGLFVGSLIGGYIPTLWGASFLSYSSLFGNAIGSIVGVIVAYKMTASKY